MTQDMSVQRQLMRLHGFSLMSMLLLEYPQDVEVMTAVGPYRTLPYIFEADPTSRSCKFSRDGR